jgi:cob(I)alamin adenosyltransferase
MVNLTRIYTRTGDDGRTSLGDLSRTGKNDPRLHAYADSNEANAVIGVALAAGGLGDAVRETLLRVQNELFDVGADLSTPLRETYEWPPLRVQQPWVDDLEHDCDTYLTQVEKLRSFILPGGSVGSAHLHHATTVVRRAERSTWAAIDAHGTGEGGVNPLTATYLNRLSDLLFILARIANVEHGGDVLWQPGGGRVEAPSRRGGRSRRGQDDAEPTTEPTTEPSTEDAGSAS